MDFNAYKNAIQSGAQMGAPTDNLMGSRMGGNLANFMNVNFQNAATSGPTQGLIGTQARDAANQEQMAAEARANAVADLKDKLQQAKDMQDPSKFSIQKAQDGGLRYFDPMGKPISLSQYTQVTGKNPSDILKNSDNMLDKQYVNDYKNMEGIVNAFANGDKGFLDKLDPATKQKIQGYGNNDQERMTNMMNAFRNLYPNVYGGSGTGTVGQAASFSFPNQGGGGGGWNPLGGIGSWLGHLIGR